MKQKYIEGVVTLALSSKLCVGCGRCVEVCPHRVFSLKNNTAEILDEDRCMECGACARNCPASAISVNAKVGCATAIITGWLTGSEPSCDCSGGDDCC